MHKQTDLLLGNEMLCTECQQTHLDLETHLPVLYTPDSRNSRLRQSDYTHIGMYEYAIQQGNDFHVLHKSHFRFRFHLHFTSLHFASQALKLRYLTIVFRGLGCGKIWYIRRYPTFISTLVQQMESRNGSGICLGGSKASHTIANKEFLHPSVFPQVFESPGLIRRRLVHWSQRAVL